MPVARRRGAGFDAAMPPRRAPLLFALCLAPLTAQAVHYELRIHDRAEQLAAVTAEFPTRGQPHVDLFLPVWSPGFYVRQDHAAQVADFTATAGGQPLAVERSAPNRWRVTTGGAATVTAAYTLRCRRGSVTENQIHADFAVFCGPATFVGEVGQLARPHIVRVVSPDDWPDVATALPRGENGGFTARDYDWLLDSPIVLGRVTTTAFDVLGARHEWTQFGDAGAFPTADLVPKLQRVAAEACAMFGDVPFARYVFLAGFRQANGGLEHLDSTLLSVHASQRPDEPGFLSFLAHEYVHAFNVKRLRPVELGPFDYEQPPATASLWISEGLTTWLGDLAAVRSGAITTEQWLALVSGHVRSLQGSPGRKLQTLADASLAVWRQSTSGVGGDPRRTISYYTKGPVVGFGLEARLRTATNGTHGLDEVMRRAYARFGGARGFTPEQFEALAAEVAGSDQRAFFDRALRSTDELDYAEALAWFGLVFREVGDDAPRAQRWALQIAANATDDQRAHVQTLLAATPPPAAKVPGK